MRWLYLYVPPTTSRANDSVATTATLDVDAYFRLCIAPRQRMLGQPGNYFCGKSYILLGLEM